MYVYLALPEHLLNEGVVLEDLSGLHDPDNPCLDEELPLLLDVVVSLLDLLRRLLQHGPGRRDPELGPLVAVLEVDRDGRVWRETLCVDDEKLGFQQGLDKPEEINCVRALHVYSTEPLLLKHFI